MANCGMSTVNKGFRHNSFSPIAFKHGIDYEILDYTAMLGFLTELKLIKSGLENILIASSSLLFAMQVFDYMIRQN